MLDNIDEESKTIVFKGWIKIHCFQEARDIPGIKGLDEKASHVKRQQTFEHLVDLVGEVGLGISGGSAEVQGSVNVYLYSMQAFALAIVVHYTASRSARQLY
jgi:hypothetical protein